MIQTELEKTKSKSNYTYTFPILKTTSEEKEVVRFFLPIKNMAYISTEKYNFDKEYFEVKPENFKKIILNE